MNYENDVERYQLGELQTNCYLLGDKYIIDPGGWKEELSQRFQQKNRAPDAVLLTHSHYDHIGGIPTLKELFPGLKVYCHSLEAEALSDPAKNYTTMSGKPLAIKADGFVDKIDLSFQGKKIQVLKLPGHSPGGVGYYLPALKTCFCGDSIFRSSIGRTDLYGGDNTQLKTAIKKNVLTLPDETRLLPGHGPPTTVGEEIESNPYLN